MSISTPPPPSAPAKKSSGWGCFGCGCAVLVLIVVVLIGLTIAGCVMAYQKAESMTSTTQADIPGFTGDSSVLSDAQKKILAFQHDLQAHQPASIHLNSDEINALIAASPDIQKSGVHAYFTLTNDTAHVQASAPTDKLIKGVFPGRYLNFDSNFTVSFDATTKSVVLNPQTLQLGSTPLLGPDSDQSNSFSTGFARGFTPSFNQSFNQGLRGNGGGAVLDHAKNITIEKSELVIETQ